MKFTGNERDLNDLSSTADDLDYLHSRFYNPLLTRFLSVDSGEPDAHHGYITAGVIPRLNEMEASDVGSYLCIVGNAGGTTISGIASLTVASSGAPNISIIDPAGATVSTTSPDRLYFSHNCTSSPAFYTVHNTGTAPLVLGTPMVTTKTGPAVFGASLSSVTVPAKLLGYRRPREPWRPALLTGSRGGESGSPHREVDGGRPAVTRR